MSLADRQAAYTDMTQTPLGSTSNSLLQTTKNGNEINIGFDDASVDRMTDMAQSLADGLSCGFG